MDFLPIRLIKVVDNVTIDRLGLVAIVVDDFRNDGKDAHKSSLGVSGSGIQCVICCKIS